MNLLFICNQNMNRSPTAEELFSKSKKYKAKSAGIFPLFGGKMISNKLVDWADKIFVMEDWMKFMVEQRFRNIKGKKEVISLNIPDLYRHNSPRLKKTLKEKLDKWLK